METFQKSMIEYKRQLENGLIQKAYKGLISYIMNLRTNLKIKYPDHHVSGSIYQGYMDMTYFSFFPESFKKRKLKAGIVFLHESFRFEAWLIGINKQVQKEYWEFFKESGWNKYHLPANIRGADSILEHILVANLDFSDLDALSDQIEEGTLRFIKDIEKFLTNQ